MGKLVRAIAKLGLQKGVSMTVSLLLKPVLIQVVTSVLTAHLSSQALGIATLLLLVI
jgi:hypothetical protein